MRKNVANTPSDPTIEYAKLVIDEKEYRLIYDFNALVVAEEIAGVKLLLDSVSVGTLNAHQFRGLLYACLLKAQPEMTIEDAGSLISWDSTAEIIIAIGKAMYNSMPLKKRQEHDERAKAEEKS